MDERYAAERPLVIDSPAPPIAHPHTQMFAEAMRRHDLIIDDKELRLLLLGFQPLLHSSDGEGQITPRASEGVSCFRPLSLCLGFAVFRQRPIKGMELCCDVGAAVRESETVQIAGPFRSEERREGKEGVSEGRSRWSTYK